MELWHVLGFFFSLFLPCGCCTVLLSNVLFVLLSRRHQAGRRRVQGRTPLPETGIAAALAVPCGPVGQSHQFSLHCLDWQRNGVQAH